MAEFLLRYADPRGHMHEQVAEAASEREARERLAQQGYLVYSVRARDFGARLGELRAAQENRQSRKVPDLQPAVRHAGPRRAADPERSRSAGRPAHRSETGPLHQGRPRRGENGTLLSDAFAQPGRVSRRSTSPRSWPARKSGSLVEVLDRYLTYQKLTLAVRKKVMVSLMYPAC